MSICCYLKTVPVLPTGRALIRYSGTEPLLRIMIEGPDRSVIQSHADTLASLLRSSRV